MSNYVVYKGVYCDVVESGWKVKLWECPETGQREAMAWKKRSYFPQGGDLCDPTVYAPPIERWHPPQIITMQDEEEIAARKKRNLEKSAAKAKRTCRHKIKAAGFDSMLTCTYRENMQDFDRMRADWNLMLRKLKKVMPWFRAVFGFEQQTRGAWHVHAAIDKLPTHFTIREIAGRGKWREVRVRSWDYVRRMWHSIVGRDNGNIDLDGHRKTRHGLKGKMRRAESLAKLAGYVSKYLTKEYAEGIEGRNRWGSSQGIKLPRPVMLDFPECPLHDIIELAFHVPDGHRIVSHRIGQFGKFWCLYSEPGEPDIPATYGGVL